MTGEPAGSSSRGPHGWRRILPLILLPVAVQAAIVATFGEAMLAWDEFHYAHLMRAIGERRPWLHWILQQHNEHRIVWTKLVTLAHAPLSAWNPLVDMYVSALLLGVIAWGIWTLYRRAGDAPAAYFLPAALLLCSAAQFMNMLYGLMTCHYFTVAGMVWSLVFLTRGTWPALGAAMGAAGIAMWSTLNSIVVWPAGLVLLWLDRRPLAHQVAWAAGGAALFLLYFADYQSPGQHAPIVWSFGTLGGIIAATILNLGSPLSGRSMAAAAVLGVATLVLMAVSSAGTRALRPPPERAGLVGLMIVALGSAASVGFGRHQLGLVTVLESKYVTYTTLGLIAPYLCLVGQRADPRRRRWLVASLVVIGVGLIVANVSGFQQIPEWARTRRMHRYLVQTIDRQPDENLTDVYKLHEVRDVVAYLRAARLGPFRRPVDALLVPRWREPEATAEVNSGAEVSATMLCPVDRLLDFAIIVGPASSPPALSDGRLHVTLHANGRIVGRDVRSLRNVPHVDWIRVPLSEPIGSCRDQLLHLRVSTEGALRGGGVRVLTFPLYYGGITRQGTAVIRGRDLGIAFNAVANRLLP